MTPSRFLIAGFLFLLVAPLASANNAQDYTGLWWNEARDGIFELRLTENSIEGITRWGKTPKQDLKNPDPALRDRLLKDVLFLWGFSYDERRNRWRDGKVYDPDSGKTYDAKMQLDKGGSILKMRGYVGVSMFGRTARFERVQDNEMPPELQTAE